MSPNILTLSGHQFNVTNPDSATIDISDIAHALSNTCRFGGHTKAFYSVAQHSVLVSRILPKELAMVGLLHDAAEAYLGDIPSPLKQFLPDYKAIECNVEKAIFRNFGIPYPLPSAVYLADLILLATEKRDLLADHDEEWEVLRDVNPLDKVIEPLSPAEACNSFMWRYMALVSAQKMDNHKNMLSEMVGV